MYNRFRGKEMKKLGKKLIVCAIVFSGFLGVLTSCQQLKIEINTTVDTVDRLETPSENEALTNI